MNYLKVTTNFNLNVYTFLGQSNAEQLCLL